MPQADSLNPLRRMLVKLLGSAAVAGPSLLLAACGSETNNSSNATTSNDANSSDTSDSGSDVNSENTSGWATGGTAAMVVDFPETSLFATTAACSVALTQALTEGPCYFQTEVLDDISAEKGGLPMQLCLQVIDSDCNPVSGLEVEVWHCDSDGIYSGDTSDSADANRFSVGFCTDNDSAALASKWFRGTQVTDSDGRVNFKTCFPGWYSSRTIHVHFRIRNNNLDELISQFCFNDSLTADICNNHPEYASRGTQDTTLASGRDTVYGSHYEDFLFNTVQNSDGSLLAWKTIQMS
ncbi:intradiol ring-cleavage dioxygenase [Shewanella mangrovi]|uniref:Intradiol ring-cleavage dioxygenase n=1 Tax=Shewanella mangrovi TaxID=1515746 RepID=A0A094LR76_9GAMM|nr:intradiol ring-cleavage dioxygenase [Shewanella mangrovi]KFZ37683.1 intradiol ring-cleavage dioxygenase [Shewanella mangrovi]